jgi:glutamate dehydrogenase/leucine dehydrogenase
MKVVIAGGGSVGRFTAQQLVESGKELTADEEKLVFDAQSLIPPECESEGKEASSSGGEVSSSGGAEESSKRQEQVPTEAEVQLLKASDCKSTDDWNKRKNQQEALSA